MNPPQIILVRGPLGPPSPWEIEDAGALVVFDGIVRPTDDGRALKALSYEAYEPMAGLVLQALARQVTRRHGLLGIRVEHSVGDVPVAGVSFRLFVAAAHRGPALAAMGEFIDLLKRDVPIWKTPVWAQIP